MLLVVFAGETAAQERDEAAPPARVGQLSLVPEGARMRVSHAAPWEPAALNTPITTGSAVATEGLGVAEVRVGSTALRLAPGAHVVWTEINDSSVRIEVVAGIVTLRVRALAPGERVTLSAGGVTVDVLKAGAYRIRHLAPATRVAVWVQEGQARVAASPQELTLGPNQHALLDRKSATLLGTGANDERKPLDEIVDMRDRRSEHSFSLSHVSAEMTGVESLDGQGSWRTEPNYGSVWYPDRLPKDWAPYRFGRWRWIAPWGWTWIDAASWGFAPFHYGRWVFVAGRWGWTPGRAGVPSAPHRPVYAPALVGFFGTQSGAASPALGWYPLAPGEVYWPTFTKQLVYIRALNAATVSDVNQIQSPPVAGSTGLAHRFAHTAFAATAMPYAAFMSMQNVATNQIVLSPAALAQTSVLARPVPPPSGDDVARAPVSTQ